MPYDEHGNGGEREYCGDNDAQLDRTNLLYYKAPGGKYAPRAVLFDLEPGVIDAGTLSRRSANFSARRTSLTKTRARAKTGYGPTKT